MIVIDSSSLILLAKISILDNVTKNIQKNLVITNQIYVETTAKHDTFDAKLIEKRTGEKIIEIMKVKNSDLYIKIRDDFNLGRGEAEAIALCLEKKIGLITDDKKAMNACKILKIKFTTVPNLLIRLYKKELITKIESDLYLKKLERLGRYSNNVLQKTKEDLKNEKDE